ncbi:MAG TPA: citrate/2-methylcitrate synthase [Gemmataceae bacterium]|jgi:citrate synthase|nr:citrate/2-methylcitrate synthase [Gemmataceae bacterium]
MTPTPAYSPGLEGVIAGETAISSVGDGLRYRGYPVGELVEHCTFEEVAHLLLYGELPNAAQLADFQRRVAAARRLPEPLQNLLKALPPWIGGMDGLRSSVSVLAHFDQDIADNSHDANIRKAERLLAQIPLAVADHYRFSKSLPVVPARQDLSHTANFLFMLRGTVPSPDEVRALDLSLILYAEHEFNASTFTCRVVASTESDLHSCIVAGIGALKGPLHGGANEVVLELLQNAAAHRQGPEAWIQEALARKEKVMGFGHRVYKTGDVRAGILKPYASRALAALGQSDLEKTADVIETVMAREKKLYPNLDWPAGRLYHALGLERTLYTPIFVMARVAGWAAHCIEQYDHNRLIRPRAKYTGPGKRAVAPLAQRK